MKYSVKKEEKGTVISLKGNLFESDSLKNPVQETLDGGEKNVVIDMSEVKYMNSFGVMALITSLTSAKKVGAAFRIARINKKVGSILIITKLKYVFKIFETIDEALNYPDY